ncbi:SMC family ATPase [Sphaerospermopsis kisseleviana CS-549]|uniref:Nuclease SbcCD subunit C n=2 Tax=Sphaerospermopsis TaxID=752201 RepID=A0A480A048_9CYAN|nr:MULTISPECIES: SMC family ATPase [Sphaerospermopsis]MDB9441586.1 SMC family ATPase [Sphaerospermopsis kisseleviana CS-549]BAZ83638.1 exonuclease SbcC [Sphaerospermopsis kisseleviana NIES-73]GCL38167.1 exonuclease SbcC [Sphaerospermopsis reniformis]
MRPLELTLEGFTSFRNQTKINFEQLELFAITGPTGAGKSSLLDAMTLALYGKVARFSGKTQPKELLSQGSLRLQVSLRFLVDNFEYQVFRSWLYRNKTPQVNFKLEKRIQNDWQPLGEQKEADINATIENILRMNFETFTKVILLPQGQFDEFLKGKGADRRKILSHLAGYEKIFPAMRQKAENQANFLEGEYNIIQQQLNMADLVSDIELNSQRERSQLIEQELPRLNEAVANAKTALEVEIKLFQRLKILADLRQQLEELNTKTTEISVLKRQLEQARVCDRLSATWTSVNSARTRYNDTKIAAENAAKALIDKESALKIQEDNLSQAQAYQAKIAPQLKQQEEALNAAKIYEEQRRGINNELKRLEKILEDKIKLVTEANKAVKKAETELAEKNKIFTEAKNELSQYSLGGTRLEQLNQVNPLLIKWEGIQKQVESDRSKLQQITQQLKTADNNYQSTILNLQKSIEECEQICAKLDTARQQNYASALRVLLHKGDDCPVCGGVYPEDNLLPQLESSDNIKALEKRAQTAEKNRQKAADAKTKAETIRDELKKQEIEYLQILAAKEVELQAETQQIIAILKTDTWDVQALQQECQTLHERDTKYQESLIKKDKADAEVNASEQNFKFAKDKLSNTQSQHQEAANEVERQKTQFQEISNKLSELTGGDSYENLVRKLEQDKQDLDNRLQQAHKFHQTARDEFLQSQQNDLKSREDFDLASNAKVQIEAEWQTRLSSENFTEAMCEESKASPEVQNRWQQQITDHDNKKLQLETLITKETNEIGNKTTNPEIIAQHEKFVVTAEEKRKQSQDEYNNLKLWITKAEEQREQAEKLQAQLSSKEQDLEIYRILSKELKSDRFQAYILQNFEQELVEQATVFLRELTEQRYALKYDDKEYYVEDNWSGGETRRVQTLSGGETFATSLSLALALSEKLSRGAKLGSLFIDEGFGTLDAETLQSVSSILQSLGQQDKLVGVITHVPALGEELGTQIKVEKFPEGSRIIMA